MSVKRVGKEQKDGKSIIGGKQSTNFRSGEIERWKKRETREPASVCVPARDKYALSLKVCEFIYVSLVSLFCEQIYKYKQIYTSIGAAGNILCIGLSPVGTASRILWIAAVVLPLSNFVIKKADKNIYGANVNKIYLETLSARIFVFSRFLF